MKDKKAVSQKKQMKVVDWKEINHQLKITQKALEQGRLPTLEEKKKLLKTRAKALAKEPRKEKETQEYIEILEFLLAYEKYGIESSYVREVYPLKEFTAIPCTPSFVLGIINVRGQLISVIDIKKFFGLPERGIADLNKVIILHKDDMEFGILADVISGVHNISLRKLQTSLPTLTGIREKYLKGITEEQVIILDAEKLLSDKTIVVHEEVER